MRTSKTLDSFLIAVLTTAVLAFPNGLVAHESDRKEAGKAESASWQEEAIEYARIMSQVRWTPVADGMPTRQGGHFEKGKQYTGVPYSSVRSVGRYIGFDISLKTFLAAVENPHSVLYTENLSGKVPNAAPYYGKVCSTYTSYALQCGIWHVSRHHGPRFREGVVLVEPQSAQATQVGDIIYTPPQPGSHVEIVTEVVTDDDGVVTSVRVEDSWPSTTRTLHRTAAKFDAHISSKGRVLQRITDLDAWRGENRAESFLYPNYQADSATPAINRTLLLDLGDWVPYQKGQAVKFNVMDKDSLGVSALVIEREGTVVESIDVSDTGVIERSLASCGDYTAHVVRKDGTASQSCEFSICDLDFSINVEKLSRTKAWDVEFTSNNMNVIAVYLSSDADDSIRHAIYVTEQQRKTGRLTVPAGLVKKAGNLQVWLIGEHKYGRLKVRKDIAVID